MKRTIRNTMLAFTLTFIMIATGTATGWALPVTTIFTGSGTFSTPDFTEGDLTVSSPDGDLYFSNYGGLGVNNSGLSQEETIVFNFAQFASG